MGHIRSLWKSLGNPGENPRYTALQENSSGFESLVGEHKGKYKVFQSMKTDLAIVKVK